MKSIVLFSGPIAVGKSSIAKELVDKYGFRALRSSPYLAKLAADQGLMNDRVVLQNLGDTLDRDTDFRWVIDEVVTPALVGAPEAEYWLLDCVRKKRQVEHFRTCFGHAVLHVHFTAPEEVLAGRYEGRRARFAEPGALPSYPSAIAHPNEVAARELGSVADVMIDLSGASSDRVALEVFQRAAAGETRA